MGYQYHGPTVDELPESIRDRVQTAALFTQNETPALGMVLSNQAKLYGENFDPAEMWRKFGDAREVFIYDFGRLVNVYFREGNEIFYLSFCGSTSPAEMKEVEKALGLTIIRRPTHNQAEAEIMFGDEPLERLVGLGHQPNVAREDPFKFQCSSSGPYMARK